MDAGINILVADDQVLYRQGLCSLLQKIPKVNTVFETGNSRDAMRLIRENFIPVVIMDLRMPVMEGYKAVKIIHTEFPGTVIFVLSVFLVGDFKNKMDTIGADGYFTYEICIEELTEAIVLTRGGGGDRNHFSVRPFLKA